MTSDPCPVVKSGETSAVSLRRFDVILLAAGASRRFAAGNKLVEPFQGVPLIGHILRTIAGLDIGRRIVVTGETYRDGIIAELKRYPGWRECVNAQASEGMGRSIAVGSAALRPDAEGVFICPADMPGITAEDFHSVAGIFSGPRSICRPIFNRQPGHPVLFGREHFGRLGALSGDHGAAGIVRDSPTDRAVYASSNPGTVFDCDTADRFV